MQRALSETGDYAFNAPRERSGVMSPGLDTALTGFQTRTGLKPDGYAAPNGPTVQQIAAEADNTESLPPQPGHKPHQSRSSRRDDMTLAERRNIIKQNKLDAERTIEDWTRLAETKRKEIADINKQIAELEGIVLPGVPGLGDTAEKDRQPNGKSGKGRGRLRFALEFGSELGGAVAKNLASDQYIAALKKRRAVKNDQLQADRETIERARQKLETAERNLREFENEASRDVSP